MNSLVQISLLVICMGSLFLSSFTVPSSFLLNNNVKFAYGQEFRPPSEIEGLVCNDGLPPYPNSTCPDGISPQPILANETSEGLPLQQTMADNHVRELSAGGNATSFQEEIQMDTNGDGVVDAADNPIPSDTTNTSSTPPPEEIQMDTNGDGVVDEFESQNQSVPSDTTNTSDISPPEEIQMDTNGDGVVDEFESQNQSVTSPPEEIQMDTNGDGVVDAADNPIPSDTTNTSSTPPPEEIQMDTNGDGVVDAADNPIPSDTTNTSNTSPPEEIQMDTNGDGVVDEFESQIADELVSTRNSFIVKLRSSDAVSLNKTLDLLKPDLEAAGGDVKSIYEQFGMFNLKFDGPQQAVDRLIDKLKTDPSIEAVYNDTIITGDQSTSPVIVPPQLCDDNTAPNANGVCADRSIPHYVTLRQQTECNVGSCVTKWVRAQQRTPTGIDRVDADLSPAKSGDGSGAVGADIAILDTGVQRDHPDLNVWKCVSFVDGDDPNTCNDMDGHGTHVAGIAAALDNDIGVVGTAPGARIWAIKVQKDEASGTSSDLLEGLEFVAEHSPVTQAARSQLTDEGVLQVVSMSLGSFSQYNLLKSKRDGKNIAPQLDEALKNLVEKGVVVVVSAGNDNIDVKDQSPARVPEVIVVSAITDSDGKCGGKGVDIVQKGVVQFGVERGYSPQTDRYGKPFDIPNPDDSIASYSNYGATVDLAAPGTHIYSTLPNSRYGYMSGTEYGCSACGGSRCSILDFA